MRQFHLQEPADFDEDALVRSIKNRADRFERLRGSEAPDVILEGERDLLDKACGEWVARRGGRIING